MNNYRESKEYIKDRMIRTALDFWNIRNIENLDPFVRLLIEAMAAQLHLLSEEIADIEVRTMQRLSEVLLPESVSLAQPSHAIVHIETLLEEMETNPFEGFYATDPFSGRKDELRYSFYPVCKTPLRRGRIKKLIVGGEVYESLQGLHKKLLLRSDLTPENHNKVFVGLDFAEDIDNIDTLSFYIDFPNIAQKTDYLRLLSYCKLKQKRGFSPRIRTSPAVYPRSSIPKNTNLVLLKRFSLITKSITGPFVPIFPSLLI